MFIVFEGPEGAGKSTQIQLLAKHLEQAGHTLLVTKEPGGTPTGDAIRSTLLNPDFEINPLSEFLLYSASRAQLVQDILIPALAEEKSVLCDRYFASSLAYQGYGRGLNLDFLKDISEKATQGLIPDITLLLDIEPEQGLKRVAARGAKDRLEQADLAFHKRLRHGFLELAKEMPNWHVLKAEQPAEVLEKEIWAIVSDWL